MARTISVSGKAAEASQGDGKFEPLPAGEYAVTVFKAEDGKFKGGANKDRDNINVQFRISEGQKGTNRRIFQTVGLFPEWAPKPGKKEGANNFLFFQFFKALGVTFPSADDADQDIVLPDNDEIQGEALGLVLKIEADDYAYKKALKETGDDTLDPADFKRNAIVAIKKVDDIKAAPLNKADDDEFDL